MEKDDFNLVEYIKTKVNASFESKIKKKDKKMNNSNGTDIAEPEPLQAEAVDTNQVNPATQTKIMYTSIDDYVQQTGKRFRMLKEQKARGISREEAFQELFGQPV